MGIGDIALVGGKNAALGEMIQVLAEEGIRVPGGFAVTATTATSSRRTTCGPRWPGCWRAWTRAPVSTRSVGRFALTLPPALTEAIAGAYKELGARTSRTAPEVAVRSSATAEELPDASFAGQQDTFLNIEGADALLAAVKSCFASLFTDRAIAYRRLHGFAQEQVALSLAVQLMVRSDQGASGVSFTLDTETVFPNIVLINGAWGVDECVVKGVVNPDEWRVCKPPLADPARCPIVDRRVGLNGSWPR